MVCPIACRVKAVGLNAVLGAVIGGAARLVAVDPEERRRAAALELGATEAMTPAEFAEQVRELDVVIDAVGRPATVLDARRAVRRGGTVTVVGAGRPGETVPLSAYELFHDERKLTGSFHGGIRMRRDIGMLVDLWRTGRLPVERLISDTADLDHFRLVLTFRCVVVDRLWFRPNSSNIYCDAPIRELDHIHRRADGGPTSFDNGRGLCAFHNQVRENPGWHAERIGDWIVTTTPTGHTYESDDRNGTTASRPRAQEEEDRAA